MEKYKELQQKKEDLTQTIASLVSEKFTELLTQGSYNDKSLVINLSDGDDFESSSFEPAYNLSHKLTVQLVNDRKGYADHCPFTEGQVYFSYDDSYFKANLELIISPYTKEFEEISEYRKSLRGIKEELTVIEEAIRREEEKALKEQLVQQKLKEIEALKAEIETM